MITITNSRSLDAVKDKFKPPTASKQKGGTFTFKKSRLVKDAEAFNTKRDMRKKFVKSTTPGSIIKRQVVKKQDGGILDDDFITYNQVKNKSPELASLNFSSIDFDPYQFISSQPSKRETPIQFQVKDSKEELLPVKPSLDIDLAVKNMETSSNEFDPKLGYMKGFVEAAKADKLPFRITGGFREGALTSKGVPSWHSKGYALDIVPQHGISWEAFNKMFRNSPSVIKWLTDNDMGYIDETTPKMLAKTGGTGAHYHIGKDKLAKETLKNLNLNI